MAFLKCTVTNKTASGPVATEGGYLFGLLIGSDYTNDPIVSLYDNPSAAAGDEIIPTTKVDASAFGMNGFMPGTVAIPFDYGMYLSLTVGGGGSAEVLIYYRLKSDDLPSKGVR